MTPLQARATAGRSRRSGRSGRWSSVPPLVPRLLDEHRLGCVRRCAMRRAWSPAPAGASAPGRPAPSSRPPASAARSASRPSAARPPRPCRVTFRQCPVSRNAAGGAGRPAPAERRFRAPPTGAPASGGAGPERASFERSTLLPSALRHSSLGSKSRKPATNGCSTGTRRAAGPSPWARRPRPRAWRPWWPARRAAGPGECRPAWRLRPPRARRSWARARQLRLRAWSRLRPVERPRVTMFSVRLRSSRTLQQGEVHMPSRNRRPLTKNNTAARQTATPLASRTSPPAEPPPPQEPPDQQLLDLHQVKQLLQMSRSSIYVAIAEGDFPGRSGSGAARSAGPPTRSTPGSRADRGVAGLHERPLAAPRSKLAARVLRRGTSASRSSEGIGASLRHPDAVRSGVVPISCRKRDRRIRRRSDSRWSSWFGRGRTPKDLGAEVQAVGPVGPDHSDPGSSRPVGWVGWWRSPSPWRTYGGLIGAVPSSCSGWRSTTSAASRGRGGRRATARGRARGRSGRCRP